MKKAKLQQCDQQDHALNSKYQTLMDSHYEDMSAECKALKPAIENLKLQLDTRQVSALPT